MDNVLTHNEEIERLQEYFDEVAEEVASEETHSLNKALASGYLAVLTSKMAELEMRKFDTLNNICRN